MKGVVYQGVRLMPGSEAYRLWEAKEFKKLAQHMKELDDKQLALEGVITGRASCEINHSPGGTFGAFTSTG